jgi:hypothetical protein
VIRRVFAEQRCWPGLARLMAAIEERGVVIREAYVLAHAFVPLIGDRREVQIYSRPARQPLHLPGSTAPGRGETP